MLVWLLMDKMHVVMRSIDVHKVVELSLPKASVTVTTHGCESAAGCSMWWCCTRQVRGLCSALCELISKPQPTLELAWQ
jgi:hypothetical protein